MCLEGFLLYIFWQTIQIQKGLNYERKKCQHHVKVRETEIFRVEMEE